MRDERPGVRRMTGALLAALAILCTPAKAFGIDDLMAELARTASARARFVETRHFAIVDRALVSSGELRFTAPDRLEKRTLEPERETLLLEGGRLRIERPGHRTRVFEVQDRPEMAALVESVRGTLAGDRATLERHYEVALEGGADAWRLALAPREPSVRKVLQRVRIEGAQSSVRFIAFELAGGDRTEMTIEPMP